MISYISISLANPFCLSQPGGRGSLREEDHLHCAPVLLLLRPRDCLQVKRRHFNQTKGDFLTRHSFQYKDDICNSPLPLGPARWTNSWLAWPLSPARSLTTSWQRSWPTISSRARTPASAWTSWRLTFSAAATTAFQVIDGLPLTRPVCSVYWVCKQDIPTIGFDMVILKIDHSPLQYFRKLKPRLRLINHFFFNF